VLSLEAVACSSYCNTVSGSGGIEAYISGQLASFSVLSLLVRLTLTCKNRRQKCRVGRYASTHSLVHGMLVSLHDRCCLTVFAGQLLRFGAAQSSLIIHQSSLDVSIHSLIQTSLCSHSRAPNC